MITLVNSSKIQSSGRQIPVRSLKGGVMVTATQRQLILKVAPINFELLSLDQQDLLLDLYQDFLNSLKADVQVLVQIRQLRPSVRPDASLPTAATTSDWQIFSRDFYLIVSSLRSSGEQEGEAVNQLHLQTSLIQKGLANLGLPARLLAEDEMRQLLFDCYHAPNKVNAADWQDQSPSQGSPKPIGYQTLEEKVEHLKLNDKFVQTLCIADYPACLAAGCLNSLIQANLNLDISCHLSPVDSRLAVYRLTRKITELESSKRSCLRSGRLIDETIADPLESAMELRSKIQKHQELLFQASLYITIYAASEVEMTTTTETVKHLLSTKLFNSQICVYQQLPAWHACLPYRDNSLEASRTLDSSSAALLFPFINSEIAHRDGILYGLNQNSRSLVIINRFSLPNANSVILAQSGAGKSYAMKVEILRQYRKGVQILILDPENEYQLLAERLGGDCLDVARGDETAINFLDRSLSAGIDIAEHILQVMQILEVMLEGLDADEKAAIDAALLQLYRGNDKPLLSDLYQVLGDQNPKLRVRLRRFTEGSLASVFNTPTTLKLEGKVISFNLQNVAESLRPTLMLVLSQYIGNQIRGDLRPRLLVIDEAWSLIEDNACGRYVSSLLRRARKYYLGVCLISQQSSDFLDSDYGQALIAQSSLKILLRQDAITIREVARQFHLSEYEQHFLLTCEVGQALIIADKQHATVKILAESDEHPLITTNPAERQALDA